jgi:hypothetical protein
MEAQSGGKVYRTEDIRIKITSNTSAKKPKPRKINNQYYDPFDPFLTNNNNVKHQHNYGEGIFIVPEISEF